MNPPKLAVDDAVDVESGMMNAPAVAVIVPVLSDAAPLDRLYADYSAPLVRNSRSFEFLFMIEPWAEDRVECLYDLVDRGEPIRILEVGQAVGETAMLVAAVDQTAAPIVVTLMPYLRVAPDGILDAIHRVESGEVDVAAARRRRGRRTVLNRLLGSTYHALLRRTSGGDLRDLGSGVRAVDRAVFSSLPLYGDSARYLPVLALREGHVVEEIVVDVHPEHERLRIYGPGTYVRRLVDLIGLTFLFRFSQKPLRFFGMAGGALLTWGAVIMGILIFQRVGGEPLANRPVLILGALLAVLGVQSIALGLIGEIIVHLTSNRPRYRVRAVYSRSRGAQAPLTGDDASSEGEDQPDRRHSMAAAGAGDTG